MARPIALTPEIQRSILVQIRRGVPMKYAAPKSGIAYTTALRWMLEGKTEGGNPLCAVFRAAVLRARGQAVSRLVKMAWEHAQTENGAAIVMRLLACYAPETFARGANDSRREAAERVAAQRLSAEAGMSNDDLIGELAERVVSSADPEMVEARRRIVAMMVEANGNGSATGDPAPAPNGNGAH